MPGILYLVATPIGNLGDITLRAIETLKNADLIACEDTRRTEKLLASLGLHKSLTRYDEHTHAPAARKLIEKMNQGQSVALVTDAGTPGISDPGNRLVHEAVSAGLKVVPIPGPSSVATAVSASGFSEGGFTFLGFLPRRPGRARRELQESIGLGRTVVVFESPFRVDQTLNLIEELAPAAPVVVARELTKIHEEFLRGTAHHVREEMKTRPQKGECVILIG
jgi:16S rRNA (cytidine1402-2'-O)-methyltransferase